MSGRVFPDRQRGSIIYRWAFPRKWKGIPRPLRGSIIYLRAVSGRLRNQWGFTVPKTNEKVGTLLSRWQPVQVSWRLIKEAACPGPLAALFISPGRGWWKGRARGLASLPGSTRSFRSHGPSKKRGGMLLSGCLSTSEWKGRGPWPFGATGSSRRHDPSKREEA